jgi:hypothetical protein
MPHSYCVLNKIHKPVPNPHGAILAAGEKKLVLFRMEQPIITHGHMSHRVFHVPDILVALQTLDQLLPLTAQNLRLRVRRNNQDFLLGTRIADVLNDVTVDWSQDAETVHRFVHTVEIP